MEKALWAQSGKHVMGNQLFLCDEGRLISIGDYVTQGQIFMMMTTTGPSSDTEHHLRDNDCQIGTEVRDMRNHIAHVER